MRFREMVWLGSWLMTGLLFAAQGGKKPITLKDFTSKETRPLLQGKLPRLVTWLSDDAYVLEVMDQGTAHLMRVDALSGVTKPWLDEGQLLKQLKQLSGLKTEEIQPAISNMVLDKTNALALITLKNGLYLMRLSDGSVVKMVGDGSEELIEFSPDSKQVAYVRNYDLYVADVATLSEKRLTQNGTTLVRNGQLDWIYEEEVFERGNQKGYWWSPNSKQIAYYQIDDTKVPQYTLVDESKTPPAVEVSSYPTPGDVNPVAKLGIVNLAGETQWVNLDAYSKEQYLLVNVAFDDQNRLYYQVQNRRQTWLDLVCYDLNTSKSQRVLRETSPGFATSYGNPYFLKNDGGFLWLSDRDGYVHLYRYDAKNRLEAQLTKGAWNVYQLYGANADQVYFQSNRTRAIDRVIDRVSLKGGAVEGVLLRSGWHLATMSPNWVRMLDAFSTIHSPWHLSQHFLSGDKERVVQEIGEQTLAGYEFVAPELFQVKAPDGYMLEASLVRPPNFNPHKKYPVVYTLYGGPNHPVVVNAWNNFNYGLVQQAWAQEGIVSFSCDNRSNSAKDRKALQSVYRSLGSKEFEDIKACVAWLRQQPFVDKERIGLFGWSFGGYLVTYALTHSDWFAMGMAGGTVTDWHFYDSIYTERLMDLPANNPKGYETSSVLKAAKNLKGKLLLMQGAVDNNVHPQNTIKLVLALQEANIPFEMMLYPGQRHGVANLDQVRFLEEEKLRFIKASLHP